MLVKQTQDGWRKVKTLFEDRKGDAPGGSFTWDVDESYPACRYVSGNCFFPYRSLVWVANMDGDTDVEQWLRSVAEL